jgi:hypothetical protein
LSLPAAKDALGHNRSTQAPSIHPLPSEAHFSNSTSSPPHDVDNGAESMMHATDLASSLDSTISGRLSSFVDYAGRFMIPFIGLLNPDTRYHCLFVYFPVLIESVRVVQKHPRDCSDGDNAAQTKPPWNRGAYNSDRV